MWTKPVAFDEFHQIRCVHDEQDWPKNWTLWNATSDRCRADCWEPRRTACVRPVRYDRNHCSASPLNHITTVGVAVVCCGRPCRMRPSDRSNSAKAATSHSSKACKMSDSTRKIAVSVEKPGRYANIVDQVVDCSTASDRPLASQRAVLVTLMQQTNSI